MTEVAERLRAELLRLPTQDRAELAYCLLRSLDNESDVDTLAAWEVALDRRWRELKRDEDDEFAADKLTAPRRKCS